MRTAACVLSPLIAAIGITLSGGGTLAEAKELPFKIDAPTARHLVSEGAEVIEMVVHDTGDEDRRSAPPFFNFVWQVTPTGGNLGYFSVNPWTGDVWTRWSCKRLSTPALHKSQAKIRKLWTAAELKQYAKLHHLRPACVGFKVDAPTARRLVAEGSVIAENDLVFQRRVDHPKHSSFLFVDAFCRTEETNDLCRSTQGTIFGGFAVNPWTGDVWSTWECKSLSTPALRRSQGEIRRRFTAEELKQYEILSRVQPCTTN